MDSIKQIAAALVKAQKGFGPALKASTNPHFKSKYADLAAVIEAVIDSLNESGIALIQKQHPNEGGVCVETVFVHESGETLSAGLLTVPAAKNDPQGYGSALTYARRYSLMAACGIAPEDDDGNAAKRPAVKPENQGAHSGPAIAFNGLPLDWQGYLRELAAEVENVCEQQGPEAARQLVEERKASAQMEAEHIAGLWSLLTSKTRAKLKPKDEAYKAGRPASTIHVVA